MIKNVKSSYILRIIISLIDEKRKLKLIKYNISLLKNMNKRLINNKIFSGKHIIYEENRKGKEIDYDGDFEFEGEFLNGESNGKGKEYGYESKLIFEDKYFNWKKE